MSPDVTYDRIMQTATGFWSAKVLLSAVEIGVFGELAAGSLDAESLRVRLGLYQAPSALTLFLRRKPHSVIPAKAGTQCWASAFAGVTNESGQRAVGITRAFSTRLL